MTDHEQVFLKQIPSGPMENFSYFIGDRNARKIAVVDPAWDVGRLTAMAGKEKLDIVAALLTHGHYDHAQGVAELLKKIKVPVYLSRYEAEIYTPDIPSLTLTENGEKIKIGGIEIECIHTPGHTPGCQCYRCGDILLTGDVLFIDGCGRCDLPGGDPEKMYHTLYDKILKLPDTTIIYPGHHYGPVPYASLLSQKKTNPYLTASSKEEFLRRRMGC